MLFSGGTNETGVAIVAKDNLFSSKIIWVFGLHKVRLSSTAYIEKPSLVFIRRIETTQRTPGSHRRLRRSGVAGCAVGGFAVDSFPAPAWVLQMIIIILIVGRS